MYPKNTFPNTSNTLEDTSTTQKVQVFDDIKDIKECPSLS